MTTETQRDLHADLALCEAAANASPGKWFVMHGKDVCAEFPPGSGELDTIANSYTVGIPEFIAEAREGWSESLRRAIAAEAEVEQLRNILGYIYQKARNDCAMWDGKMCVGLPVFQDRVYARKLVRELSPILFPEVTADATR